MSKTGTRLSLRNNGFVLLVSSIMSDDSPAEPKESYSTPGRSTPPPTTSYSVAKPDSVQLLPGGDSTNEPPKSEKNEKDDLDISSPDANPGCKPDTSTTNGEIRKKDDSSDGRGGGSDNKESDSTKMNGLDRLDGQWIKADTKSNSKENEEESCAVNCIYYTLQCCECTIS